MANDRKKLDYVVKSKLQKKYKVWFTMEKELRIRHNPRKIVSVMEFAQTKGDIKQNTKDVYFVRLLGDNGTLLRDMEQMDAHLSAAMAERNCMYQRITKLPGLPVQPEVAYYTDCYQNWKQSGELTIETEQSRKMGIFPKVLAQACQKAVKALADSKNSLNASIEKNFVVKILYWLDQILKKFPGKWEQNSVIKIVSHNITRGQEYCFFYFLSLLGMDVLLIQSRQDVGQEIDRLGLSYKQQLGEWATYEIPEYHFEIYQAAQKTENDSGGAASAQAAGNAVKIHLPERNRRPVNSKSQHSGSVVHKEQQVSSNPVKIHLPERNRRSLSSQPQPANASAKISPPQRSRVDMNPSFPQHSRADTNLSSMPVHREKSFEELAQLASSVVLVGIHNNRGEMIGTGSGIMIGTKGYILTNNHVASGGCFYTVRIEEEQTVYETEEVIKYNPLLDLAVLRIDRILQPLPIYAGSQKLVRGQRVVAIGSPLGLFNSVSDGIISGFRVINDVDMIQFTAPISHGSSGGALLNMYGEVIGISTAGIDEGQNINLAIGYECIRMFVQGFIC